MYVKLNQGNDVAPHNKQAVGFDHNATGLNEAKPTTTPLQSSKLQRSSASAQRDKNRVSTKEVAMVEGCTKSKSGAVPIHNRYSYLQLSE